MLASLLKGKPVAKAIQQNIESEINRISSEGKRAPHLAVIIVGNDEASHIYVKNKSLACEKVGISSKTYHLNNNIKQSELEALINQLNEDSSVDGILVQLPLPQHINSQLIIEQIAINKDVDGFHPYNVGRLAQRSPHLRPCTPFGIIRLLEFYSIEMKYKQVTIVGASNIVGRPLSSEMLLQGATVTTCHRFTANLKPHIINADIVVSATGVCDIIDPNWFKSSATVIDVGIHRKKDGKLRGDIDFEQSVEKVANITPVPGGVGPLTIAILLENTLRAYQLNQV